MSQLELDASMLEDLHLISLTRVYYNSYVNQISHSKIMQPLAWVGGGATNGYLTCNVRYPIF